MRRTLLDNCGAEWRRFMTVDVRFLLGSRLRIWRVVYGLLLLLLLLVVLKLLLMLGVVLMLLPKLLWLYLHLLTDPCIAHGYCIIVRGAKILVLPTLHTLFRGLRLRVEALRSSLEVLLLTLMVLHSLQTLIIRMVYTWLLFSCLRFLLRRLSFM